VSQHDLHLDNQLGAQFRQDLHAALQALAGNSSGSSAPTVSATFQRWADTANNIVRQRNALNSAWIVRGTLAETFASQRSTDAQLTLRDHGSVLAASGAWTQSIAAASTLGDAWRVRYRNIGAGIMTLRATGSDLIDGALSVPLYPGEDVEVCCDGGVLFTTRQRGEVLIASVTASLANSVWFPIALAADCNEFRLSAEAASGSTSPSWQIILRVSTDGVTPISTAIYDHTAWLRTSGGAWTNSGLAGNTGVPLVDRGAGLDGLFNGNILFNKRARTAQWQLGYNTPGGEYSFSAGSALARTAGTSPLAAIELTCGGGGAISGTFHIYGIRRP
jgi:hypothetical protein